MSYRKISAVFIKQLQDTGKNKAVLIQYILMPIMALVMTYTVKSGEIQDNFFVTLFATMYIGMAPLSAIASIIAEDKETNTLRVLMLSNVKSVEYLLGIGSNIFIFCLMGSIAFGIIGQYSIPFLLQFIVTMCVGIITSLSIGAAIGMLSKNQMSAVSISLPVMMIFAFLPMIASFNDSIMSVSRLTYTQQINDLIRSQGQIVVDAENVIVVIANIAISALLFIYAYRKRGLS